MKSFNELTYLGQLRRFHKSAVSAATHFGLANNQISFNARSENTTYKVIDQNFTPGSEPSRYEAGKFILRIHRPEHQTKSRIHSEMTWLHALRSDNNLPVPEPIPTKTGEWLSLTEIGGLKEPRNCTVLRWVKGHLLTKNFKPRHFQALGRLTACLHQHSRSWTPPAGFDRRSWDWEGLFGDQAGFERPASEVWDLVPQKYKPGFLEVAEQVKAVMRKFGTDNDYFGLIHADLTIGPEGNVIFHQDEARAIDFDDCGFGYWIHDFATSLCHWQLHPYWEKFKESYFEGYSEILPLPKNQLDYLPLFMAGRHVSEILWGYDLAQTRPDFAEEIDGWVDYASENVELYLKAIR